MATIDVLLPVRNALPFLGESIESIQNQTFGDWRLLILDHGSSDGSLEVAQRYEEDDSRIKVFSLPEADGLGELLNAGIEKCDCKYMLRHDGDDMALPKRMELTNKVFTEDQKQVVVGGESIMIDANGRNIGYLYRPGGAERVTASTFFYCPVTHGTLAIHFSAFKKTGALYGVDFLRALPASESITVKQHAEDYFLFGQLALIGLCNNIRSPLIKYRVHRGSTSISKLHDQVSVACSVSRFLSRSFCRMKSLPEFDPVPFSNHPGHQFQIDKRNLSDEYRKMSETLLRGLGDSPALRRELAFRWVMATRQPWRLLSRYAAFEMRHRRNGVERAIVRGWAREYFRSPTLRVSI
jgi:hypothetical protein